MSSRSLAVAVAAAALLQVAAPLGARQASPNPHGPLQVGCEHCHSPEGWTPLRRPLPFDHGKETGFPLLKSHSAVACLGCHEDLRFAFVPTACADCHENVHQATLGFDCQACHTPGGWHDREGIFAIHAASLLPLTGAHATLDCVACHREAPPFEHAATPVACVDCHLEDFRRAVPDHVRLGFPRTCGECHDTFDFANADFSQHDQLFPIFSGPHRGVWNSCSECHPGGFQSFTCLTCHEHRRSEMDDEHDDVRGYRYESSACLACHPTGRE
ncbi:MAG TPA: hypothetical protein VF121_00460 [Thermoanaerobaculia bacterium]|nr:hypothetical protein [Thermoanaerobaculia bacterium]